MKSLLILFAVFVLITTGCSSVTTKPASDGTTISNKESPDKWRARGKFSYRSSEVTESGNFDWSQDGKNYKLRLFGPLGLGSVKISGNPNLVRIQTNKQDISSDQPLSLLYRITGFEIPLNSMPMWLLGKPASGSPSDISFDAEGRIQSFNERAWSLSYNDYQQQDNQHIATTVNAHKDDISLRMLVYSWKTESK